MEASPAGWQGRGGGATGSACSSRLVDHELEVHGAFPQRVVAAIVDVLGPGAALHVDQDFGCNRDAGVHQGQWRCMLACLPPRRCCTGRTGEVPDEVLTGGALHPDGDDRAEVAVLVLVGEVVAGDALGGVHADGAHVLLVRGVLALAGHPYRVELHGKQGHGVGLEAFKSAEVHGWLASMRAYLLLWPAADVGLKGGGHLLREVVGVVVVLGHPAVDLTKNR